jgi:Peptidase family M50
VNVEAGGTAGYFVLFVVLGIVAHELGHAVVAWGLGGQVDSITIGTGPQVARLRFGSVAVTLRLIPMSGLTVWRGEPAQRRWPRLAVALAGVGVNLLCVVGVVLAGPVTPVRSDFLIANLALAVYNLVPMRSLGGGALDGLTAWHLILGRPSTLTREQLGQARDEPTSAAAETLRQRLRGRLDRDHDIAAAQLLAQLPGGEPGRAGRPATEDLERIRQLVANERLPAAQRASLAFHVATTGLPGLDPAATSLDPGELSWCASMLGLAAELAPRAWPILQALALTLALQGAGDRARQLAGEALDWAPSDLPRSAKALLEATAGLAAAAAGRFDEAAQRLMRAREWDSACPMVPLVEAALAG